MGMLVELANYYGEFGYKAIAEKTLGGHWPSVASFFVLFYNLGICVSYPVLLGDFLYALALSFKITAVFSSKRLCMTIAVVCICWPLSCASTLSGLTRVSVVGLAGIAFSCVAVVKRYLDDTYESA